MNFELKEFASIPADDRNEFPFTLETLALKKSGNVHIFEAQYQERTRCSCDGELGYGVFGKWNPTFIQENLVSFLL